LSQLNCLRQGSRSLKDTLADLDRLLLEAGAHGWDDRIKKNYLRQAINNSLRDKLISIEEVETFSGYHTQVRNIAD
jgi:type II secretory pathway component PulM